MPQSNWPHWRHALGQEKAKPLLDDFRSKIEAAVHRVARQCTHQGLPVRAHALEKLIRFLEYPELELSTNLAENSMGPFALGGKNWTTHRQPTGRTKDCGDSVGGGKLPQAETPSTRQLVSYHTGTHTADYRLR